jgi:hypothetical protein
MFVARMEAPTPVSPTILQGIVEAICDRPGESAEQRRARSCDVVRCVQSFAPRDPVELMFAGMAVLHAHLIEDSARDLFRERDERLKTRAKSSIAALDRGMLGFLRELRVASKRPLTVAGDMPELDVPEPDMPEPDVPELDVPESNVPESNVPESNVPESNVPEPSVPEPSVPEPSVPELNVPAFDLPEPDAEVGPDPVTVLVPAAIPTPVAAVAKPKTLAVPRASLRSPPRMTAPEPPVKLLPPLRQAATSVAAMMAVISPPGDLLPIMPGVTGGGGGRSRQSGYQRA